MRTTKRRSRQLIAGLKLPAKAVWFLWKKSASVCKSAYKILFTDDALEDLEIGASLLNHVELLQTFSRIGVPVPRRPGIRKILHN